jgi:hypothetical protein
LGSIENLDSIKEKVSINTDPKQEFYDNDTDQEYESEVDETYDESKRTYSGSIVKIKNYSRSSQGNYQKDANYYQEPYNIPNVFPSPSLLATHAKEIQTYATTPIQPYSV